MIDDNNREDCLADLYDYKKCLLLKDEHEERIRKINNELNLSNPNSTIKSAINDVTKLMNEFDDLTNKAANAMESITTYLNDVNEVQEVLGKSMEQLKIVECAEQYVTVVQAIEILCNNLEAELKKNDYERCTTTFANLTEMCRHLTNTPGIHLQSFVKDTVYHWYNILKNCLSGDFNDVLKAMNWPFINQNLNAETILDANIKKLQLLVEYLFQIDLPEEFTIPSESVTFLASFQWLSLPIRLFIEPLRKRFLYHFYGSRKTNRIDKPEWYFTKILSWIRDHYEFIEKIVQPIVDKMGLYRIEAKVEFMRGLVQLAVEKLYGDLPSLKFNDFAFSHCIDEALGFDKELRESYDYPSTQPGVLLVLTQAQVFIKWIEMERKFALEKMDATLSESFNNDYLSLSSSVGMDDFKITPSAEIFITLLQTITERYEALPQPGHRLQFLDLQLELLDDFRVRLLQLLRVEKKEDINSKVAMIANTAYYIENVLVDWGSMLHFLTLYYYKNQYEIQDLLSENRNNGPLNDIDTVTVFTDIISLYVHMKNDLISKLVENVTLKIKKCSNSYCHEMWSNMTIPKDKRSLSLTPSACPIFEVVAMKLHQLHKYLTNELFTITWRLIAKNIDTFFFQQLILENRFNDDGARQLKFDINRNLFPLFSHYTEKPEKYCSQINEATILLNLNKGSALLLQETLIVLENATGVEDKRMQALNEIGLITFEPKLALQVLYRRADLTVNRLSFD